MVFPIGTYVECFQRFLNSLRLCSIRVVKHHANRFVARIFDALHAGMLLGNVVAVRRRITPFDFNCIAFFNKAINFESLEALSNCV